MGNQFQLNGRIASGDQCELSQSSRHLIQATFTGKTFLEISAIFPLVSAISTQISPIVLDTLWGLKPIVASNKSPVGPLWSSIRFASGKSSFNPGFLAQRILVYRQGASLTSTRLAETPNNEKKRGHLKRHPAAAPRSGTSNQAPQHKQHSDSSTLKQHQQHPAAALKAGLKGGELQGGASRGASRGSFKGGYYYCCC